MNNWSRYVCALRQAINCIVFVCMYKVDLEFAFGGRLEEFASSAKTRYCCAVSLFDPVLNICDPLVPELLAKVQLVMV